MGRRGLSVDSDEHWVFNRLADAYAARPAYPAALVDRLAALAEGAPVAELGAGRGHLTLALAERGLRVTAVEPARKMLERLRDAASPRVECVHAAAEATGLPAGAFGLVVLADALHWVDPERAGREVARLLAPRGVLAVVEAVARGTPFTDALRARMTAANPKARGATGGALGQLFSLAVGRRPLSTERWIDEAVLPREGLPDFVQSMSFAGPALAPAELDGLVNDARALAAEHGARWRRELLLTWARKAPAR